MYISQTFDVVLMRMEENDYIVQVHMIIFSLRD